MMSKRDRTCRHCGTALEQGAPSGQAYCSLLCQLLYHVDAAPGQGEDGDCWVWKGSGRAVSGAGELTIRKEGKPFRASAPKLSYELHKGKVPPGMAVIATCGTTGCVNPKHLALTEARRRLWPLSDHQVREVRTSALSGPAIAEQMGIPLSTVNAIRSWKIHRHVPNE